VREWLRKQSSEDRYALGIAITKTEMARRMRTSRSQLDRLLDPTNDKVLLETMQKAASAVGKRLVIDLEDISKAA
jgi:antitoxin HicB